MCKVYGYARISRKTQSIERQVTNIKSAYPDAVIFQEAFTGTRIEGREKFERLCRIVKEGDTIVFDSVSRMSRNAEEGVTQYMKLFNDGINLVFIKEPYINTSVYASKLKQADVNTGKCYLDEGMKVILMGIAKEQIRLAFTQAQKEVDDLHQRTREGIREVKAKNARIEAGIEKGKIKQIGQAKGRTLTVKKAITAKEIIRQHSKYFGGSLSDAECIKLSGCSRNSFYKYKAELKKEKL